MAPSPGPGTQHGPAASRAAAAPVLGDILQAAYREYRAAEQAAAGAAAAPALTAQALRVTRILDRYLSIAPAPEPGTLEPPGRMRYCLRTAAFRLAGALPPAAAGTGNPAAGRLAAAADALAAGADMLQAHAPPRALRDRRRAALRAAAVAGAADEAAAWARRLAVILGHAAAVSTGPGGAREWLAAAAECPLPARPEGTTARDCRLVLAAVPVPGTPPPAPVRDGETPAELQAGIAASARRLRHAAIALAAPPPARPGPGAAWGTASARMRDACLRAASLASALAARGVPFPGPALDAAAHLAAAGAAWGHAARTQDAVAGLSEDDGTAADAAHLAARLALLAAPGPGAPETGLLLAAVHETAIAAGSLAAAMMTAAPAVRLHVPGTVPENSRRTPWVPWQGNLALAAAARVCAGEARQAAAALDGPARACRAPSEARAVIRFLAPPRDLPGHGPALADLARQAGLPARGGTGPDRSRAPGP